MKKAFHILVLLLAMHFIAVAGGVGWLVQSGRLDRQRLAQIQEIVFPAAPVETAELQTQPAPSSQPTDQLEAFVARHAGRPATEQVELIQRTFDAQMAQMDRRKRELADLQRQVDLAREQLSRDRATLASQEQQLNQRREEVVRRQEDQGFQDSLELYMKMPPRQVKAIFMALDDPTVIAYLQAMEPRAASKILREFKTPDEISRVERVLEKMRQSQAFAKE